MTETNEADLEKLITGPHGVEENIKMDLLKMIQEGANPFDIVYRMAQYLETASSERGYARHIVDNIHTIYGVALGIEKPLKDQILELEKRHQRITDYLKNTAKDDTVSDDERARLGFAKRAHEKKIASLHQALSKQQEQPVQ